MTAWFDEAPSPKHYTAFGYAYLMRAWSGMMRCPTCGGRRRRHESTELDVWFHAPNAFRTAEMLAAGKNPWAPVPPAAPGGVRLR